MKTAIRLVAIVLAGCSSDGSTPIGAPGVDTVIDTPTPISCGLAYAPLAGGQTGHTDTNSDHADCVQATASHLTCSDLHITICECES